MIVGEEILGNVKDKEFSGCFRDEVEIEWHEAYKRINQKTTKGDREIGIRLGTEILTRGLRDGDVLYREGDTVITVCVPPCEVIVIDVREDHARMACKVCYEIGNKHAALMWGDTKLQFITPYNEPTLVLLSKLHGVTVWSDVRKLDFDRSISSKVSSHTH